MSFLQFSICSMNNILIYSFQSTSVFMKVIENHIRDNMECQPTDIYQS